MKKKKIISQICIHVILVALTAICLLPFLSMISTSFMKVKGVLPNEPILFPNFPLYLENYVKAWTANHFQTYFFNTLYVKLIDTYKGIWLLWGGTCVAGNTFFYRGFFEAVPKELEESMYLDGATRFQTLLHCIIPLSKPAIATQAVLAFNGYWSNLFDILTFTKSTNKRTLSVALQLFRGQLNHFGHRRRFREKNTFDLILAPISAV